MTHTAHAYVASVNILELPCAYACAYACAYLTLEVRTRLKQLPDVVSQGYILNRFVMRLYLINIVN